MCSAPLPKPIPAWVYLNGPHTNKLVTVGFEVLTALYIKIIAFYNVMPCSLVYGYLSAALHGIRTHKTIIIKSELPKRYETALTLLE